MWWNKLWRFHHRFFCSFKEINGINFNCSYKLTTRRQLNDLLREWNQNKNHSIIQKCQKQWRSISFARLYNFRRKHFAKTESQYYWILCLNGYKHGKLLIVIHLKANWQESFYLHSVFQRSLNGKPWYRRLLLYCQCSTVYTCITHWAIAYTNS